MFYSLISHYSITQQSLFLLTLASFSSIILTPILIFFLRKKKIGQPVRQLGPETHYHKSGTPSMGGLIFVLLPCIISLLFIPLTPYSLLLIVVFLSLGVVGFIDDILKFSSRSHHGITPKQKLIAQITIGTIAGIILYLLGNSEIFIPVWDININLSYLVIPFSVFVIVSWSNAVNLTDGLDGLAGGLSLIAIVPLIVACYFNTSIQNIDEISLIFLFITIFGTLLIFLCFNYRPASIFMGDTGSLALGGMFAISSLILDIEIVFLIVGTLFILETLSVMIQVIYYKKTQKRFFKMAPLHHHFEKLGYSEVTIVWVAMFIQLLLSGLLISYLIFSNI